MRMSNEKNLILEQLQHVFPDGIVYRETFKSQAIAEILHSKEAARSILAKVSRLARAESLSSIQWLQENGFVWRETGYIEKDMLLRECEFKRDSAVALADSIFRMYPLAGQYSMTREDKDMLIPAAQLVFQKMCREESSLNRAESLVLTLSTIELLKSWSSNSLEESGVSSFWNYIYLQYGFNPENSPVATQRIYSRFCAAIKDTLVHYRRYLAPSKTTQRYYTSLLLHALAPKESIENLLDILFDFYVRNLDFQYEEDDISYKTLVKGMQARWKEGTKDETAIKLRSSEVMSGLKTLFQERPSYMAVICDELVRTIDRIIRGEPFTPKDRWGELLQEWYNNKSSTERIRLQGQKREHRAEYVATSTERIFMQYVIEDGKVGILVPRIRLLEIGDSRPEIRLYQGTREIYQGVLSVIGNDLSLTTRRVFIPLDKTSFDFSKAIQICGEIEYMEDTLFSSGSKLYREYICFDSLGNERTVKSGILYLFASFSQEVDFLDDSDVIMEDHEGQLYRVNLSEVGAITVDGKEVFADKQNKERLRVYPTIQSIKGIIANVEGKQFNLFDRVFQLVLRVPDADNSLRYHLMIDGKRCAPLTNESEEDHFPVDPTPGLQHVVRVVDLVHSVTALEYCYIILPGFEYTLDKTLYLETENQALIHIKTDQTQIDVTVTRIPNTNLGIAESPADSFRYEIELPTAECSLGEESAFRLPSHLWYKEIVKETFSVLNLPNGWSGEVMVGGYPVPAVDKNRFETGNLIGSGKPFSPEEPLWLSLTTSYEKKKRIFFTWIVFEPKFLESPVVYCQDSLMWQPEGRFYGDSGRSFRIMISGKREEVFSTDETARQLCSVSDWKPGRYNCQVFLKSKSLFSREPERKVWDSNLVIGDENEFRFEGKSITLKNAIYWDFQSDALKSMKMFSTAGRIGKIKFSCSSIPSGETLSLPEYEGELSFVNMEGREIAFNSNEDSEEYELINPVKFWVINEHRLILRTATEDAVYFDVKRASILNRNPDKVMNRTAQKNRLKNPDYFEYELTER